MNFFDTTEPYDIADKVTNCHELAPDLVAHVYLLMRDREGIENDAAFFARCAYQQWNWRNSEFNRMYESHFKSVEFNEGLLCELSEEVIHNDQFREHFDKYIASKPIDIYDWYRREITFLHLSGMNYRTIEKKVGINRRYITEIIKQFKNDVFNSYYSGGGVDDPSHV